MTIFTNRIDAAADEAEAYVDAVLSLLGDRDPLEVLEALPDAIDRRVGDLTDEELRRPELPGKWSPIEILQHLADSDLVWAYRLRKVIARDGAELTGYDQDGWAMALDYRDVALRDALDQLRVMRAANLRLLRSLSPEQRQHSGIHSERGAESIEHMIQLYAGHDLVHLAQLDRVLSKAV